MTDRNPERSKPEGAAGRQQTDAGVLAVRIMLSAAAIALFGAFAWLATDMLAGDLDSNVSTGNRAVSAGGLPSVPAPPESSVSFNFDRSGGRHVRYESSLSMGEVESFYVRTLSAKGWKMDASLGSDVLREGPPRVVKAFTRGTARCIISAESKRRSGTAVTVLLVPRKDQAPRTPDRISER